MNKDLQRRAQQIFTALAPDGSAHSEADLDALVEGNEDLRAAVITLLQDYRCAQRAGFLESPDEPWRERTLDLPPGTTIGWYTLVELLGKGGFGSVYLAKQETPIRRELAVKIIKPGMDSEQVISRFQIERQTQTLMDHPNIAKVIDAGATDSGQPYFAMEYIRGVPITRHCRESSLSTNDKLKLFIQVCRALEHAHQKGVIHRDIKPSNVLVAILDGQAVVKVIDFGIAKAVHTENESMPDLSVAGHPLGTPEYMSPEQIKGSLNEIDTQSDIYSLGVLLYEILTGTTPFDTHDLKRAGYPEMVRIVSEQLPPKPSTRLSSALGSAFTEEDRPRDPKKIGAEIKGDLDWIVMKCLEKERSRRYPTVSALADDIVRHLENEPVSAGPPSVTYKTRKFIRRNRGQVIAAGLLAFTLIAGLASTSVGLAWALSERSRADQQAQASLAAADRAEQAKELALAKQSEAVREYERAERQLLRAVEIKGLISEILWSISPERARGTDTTLLRDLLSEAAQRLSSGDVKDEYVAAEMRYLIGNVYRSIGLYAEAEPQLRAAYDSRVRLLGEDDPETLQSASALAGLLSSQGKYDDSLRLYRDTLDHQKRVTGEHTPETLFTSDAIASVYINLGRYSDALPFVSDRLQALQQELGEDHPQTLQSMTRLATVYTNLGRRTEAEELHRKTADIQKRVLGPDHPRTLWTMSCLATACSNLGRYDEAEPIYLETIEIQNRVLGPMHQDTLWTTLGLARVYRNQRRLEDAESLCDSLIPRYKESLGERHSQTLHALNVLASVYEQQGKLDLAENVYTEVLDSRTRELGRLHPDTLWSMTMLADLYARTERYTEASSLHARALEGRRVALGSEHPDVTDSLRRLVRVLKSMGRAEEAEAVDGELVLRMASSAEAERATASELNAAAWALLTRVPDSPETNARALAFAQRACNLEQQSRGTGLWTMLDTLALAQHRTGDHEAALRTQTRAVAMMPEDADPGMLERLVSYQASRDELVSYERQSQ